MTKISTGITRRKKRRLTAAGLAVDGLVGRDADLGAAGDLPGHDDREGPVRLGGLGQCVEVTDGDGLATRAAGRAAVQGREAEGRRLLRLAARDLVPRAQELSRGGSGQGRQEDGCDAELHLVFCCSDICFRRVGIVAGAGEGMC